VAGASSSRLQTEFVAFWVGEDDPACAGRLAVEHPGAEVGQPGQFGLLIVAGWDQIQVDPVLGLLRLQDGGEIQRGVPCDGGTTAYSA